QIHVALHADEQRTVARRSSFVRARARAGCFDVRQPAFDRDLARDRFCERTSTGVPGANEEQLHACVIPNASKSAAAYASPIRLGTLSRNVLAGIAPGRMTLGRRLVQSSTVDGCDGVNVPPSRTRSRPRATASPHCSRISVADFAGGTPGRFALVDVMASP